MELPIRLDMRAQFPKHFAACEDLEAFAEANRPLEPPTRDDAGQTILATYGRSTKTFRAAVILAGQGYGVQAGMLNRSLFEDMIVAHWVRRTPSAAAKMQRHGQLLIERARDAAHRHGRQDVLEALPPPLPKTQRAAIAAEFAGGHHWTGKTVGELVNAVIDEWESPIDRRLLKQILDFDHAMNNMLLHHSGPGLLVGVIDRLGARTHLTGPSPRNVKESLAARFSPTQTPSASSCRARRAPSWTRSTRSTSGPS
jgi:hypothetical protein